MLLCIIEGREECSLATLSINNHLQRRYETLTWFIFFYVLSSGLALKLKTNYARCFLHGICAGFIIRVFTLLFATLFYSSPLPRVYSQENWGTYFQTVSNPYLKNGNHGDFHVASQRVISTENGNLFPFLKNIKLRRIYFLRKLCVAKFLFSIMADDVLLQI